jgi:hypothetical protein
MVPGLSGADAGVGAEETGTLTARWDAGMRMEVILRLFRRPMASYLGRLRGRGLVVRRVTWFIAAPAAAAAASFSSEDAEFFEQVREPSWLVMMCRWTAV